MHVINPDLNTFIQEYWQIVKIKEEKGMMDNFFRTKRDFFGGTFYRTFYLI